MSRIMYARTHEWVEIDGDEGTIGISDFAQKELGDLVFISLPDIGKKLTAGCQLCDVESVKAVSEINSPITGEVVAVNEELESSPELINQNAMTAWIARVKIASMGELLTEEEYLSFIKK